MVGLFAIDESKRNDLFLSYITSQFSDLDPVTNLFIADGEIQKGFLITEISIVFQHFDG